MSKKWCWAVSQEESRVDVSLKGLGKPSCPSSQISQCRGGRGGGVGGGLVSALPICPPCHCSGVLGTASCKYLQLSTGGRSLARLVKVGRRKLGSLGIALTMLVFDGYTPHVLSPVPKLGQLCALSYTVSPTARRD